MAGRLLRNKGKVKKKSVKRDGGRKLRKRYRRTDWIHRSWPRNGNKEKGKKPAGRTVSSKSMDEITKRRRHGLHKNLQRRRERLNSAVASDRARTNGGRMHKSGLRERKTGTYERTCGEKKGSWVGGGGKKSTRNGKKRGGERSVNKRI